jgi:ankyrin repeat protein
MLTYAIDNYVIFEYLLEKGATTESFYGNDPLLHVAVQKNKYDICELLIKNKYNVDTRRYDTTALHVAAKNGFIDIYGLLMLNGANDNLKDSRHNTPMVYICENRPELCNIFKFIDKILLDI